MKKAPPAVTGGAFFVSGELGPGGREAYCLSAGS